MRAWILWSLVAAACSNADGTRGQCAEGGQLNACPEAERTVEGACWRLVDCAAIPLKSNDAGRFDWDNCVDYIDTLTDDRKQLTIDCIAASACDSLKVDGSPNDPNTGQMTCLLIGGGP